MKVNRPPLVAAWLFRCLADSDYLPSISGDVEEEYIDVCADRGKVRSWMWYWGQILISLPSFIKSFFYWRLTMFLNYLRIAFRVIKKQKGFSFINITGLAVGMACCVLIFLWVKDELSFDRYHENSQDLYRVAIRQEGNWLTSSPWALAPVLKQEYPEIVKATRFRFSNWLTSYGERSYQENAILVDPDFFEMFTYPFLKGTSESAFSSLQSAVITKRTAEKYFGNENPIGKELRIENTSNLTVTGVIDDVPPNSHVSFDILAPVKLMGEERLASWAYESWTYVLLEQNTSVDSLRGKIVGVVEKYDKRIQGERILDLQLLTRIHLHRMDGGGNITNIYLFSTIAFFILIIACINFMNLSTARAGKRGREVALRKVVGAHRINIVRQFYGESLIHALIALVFAILLVVVLLPSFNNLAMKSLSLDVARSLPLLLVLLGITLFTGIVSGSYPALFLSSFLPVKVLRGISSKNAKNPLLRRVLVVIQFTIAIGLIVGTTTIGKQMNYIRNKELGFNRHQVLSIPLNNSTRQNFEALKSEMLQNPNVIDVSASANRPTNVGNINPVYWEGGGPDQYVTVNFSTVDYDYFRLFEMDIIKGREFKKELSTDKLNYVINEEMVKLMKIDEPVGKLFSLWTLEGVVIGVVKNFHSRPLHQEISPIVFTLNRNWDYNYLFVKIRPENVSQTLSFLEGRWKSVVPNFPFDYVFLDEVFQEQYISDQRTGTIFKYFSILAIFISCLGIFGLSAFMAEQRTKEIGVRKVLGATASSIVTLVSREFMLLLAVANVIAWPVSYILMKRMLDGYAYRTSITIWIFLLAGFLAVLIALLTVSYQAIRASRTDPIQALRYE
ncbi:ABC transporter permease [Acidobacteriota bacterium]